MHSPILVRSGVGKRVRNSFADRTISYVDRTISSSLRKGDKNYNIPTVYSISILDLQPDMFPDQEDDMWKVMLTDGKNSV